VALWALALASLLASGGCTALGTTDLIPQTHELATHPELAPIMGGPEFNAAGAKVADLTPPPISPPSELAKVALPRYRMAAPDILVINATRLFPKAPYFIQSSDFLQIIVPGAPQDQPIAGTFQVDSNGMVNLGGGYDSVKVGGMTLDEAQEAIARHLSRLIGQAQASVSLLQASGVQQIAGEHLIGPDGYINLGIYGSVYVNNMTVDEARMAIETQLAQFLDQPKVSVDVLIYNSKFFYIINEGAGFGDQVVRIPITGNETVLDAMSQIGGLREVSSKRIWISRPAPKDSGCDQILPVDWTAITRGAATATNYQLLPGDRIFVAEDRLLALNNLAQKVINPVERMMGFTLLSAQTIQFLQRFPQGFTF
jgi:protein involved in polysaccharide export with SLBB domain